MYKDFPDLTKSPAEKMSKEFFLDYATAMYSNFSRRGFRIFRDSSENFDVLISYLMGDQPVAKQFTTYDDFTLNNDNEGSSNNHSNKNFQPLAIAAKYFEIVINAMVERDFDIVATANDAMATTEMSNRKNRMKAYLNMKKNGDFEELGREPTDQEMGVEIDRIPESQEELEIVFDINEKHWASQEAEMACNALFDNNRYEEIARENAKNVVSMGIQATLVENQNGNITYKSIKPESLITSSTNYEDFRDATNAGYEETLSYQEFMSECDLPASVKKEIWKKESKETVRSEVQETGNANYRANDDSITENLIRVMKFYFKDYHEDFFEEVIKSDGSKRIWKLDDDGKPKKKNSKVYGKGRMVVKEAKWIIGCNGPIKVDGQEYSPIYGERISQNMEEKDGNPYDVELPIKMHAPRLTRNRVYPLVYMVKNIIDKMQDAWMRHQQYIAEAVPDGNAINLWALENANFQLGGNALSAAELYKLYRAKGDVIYHVDLEEITTSQAPPLTPVQNTNLGKAAESLNLVFQYLQVLREATGLNDVVGASDPNPDMLVGTAEMASQASDNALGFLFRSMKSMKEMLAKGTIQQIQNASLGGYYPDMMVNMLGKDSQAFWKLSKNIHWHHFGIKVESKPTRQQWEQFYQMVASTIGKGIMDESDLLFLIRIDNLKQAEKVFEMRLKRRRQEERANQMAMIEKQSEGNIQATQAKTQGEAQLKQMEAQIEAMQKQMDNRHESTEKDKDRKSDLIKTIMGKRYDSSMNERDNLIKLMQTMNQNSNAKLK